MKRSAWALSALVVLLAVVAFLFLRPGREAGPRTWYADYLPPSTLATVSLRDLNGLTATFPASPLGRFLSPATMGRILAGLGSAPETIRAYEKLHDAVARVMTNPAFRAIFGDDAVIAMLPPDPDRLRQEPEQELNRCLVAFATSSSSKTMERLARLIMGNKVTRESVGGQELTRIRLGSGDTVYAWSRGRALLVARSPEPLLACIRVRDGQAPTLQQETSFAAARAFWRSEQQGRPLLASFVSVPRLRALLGGLPDGPGRDLEPWFHGMDYFSSLVRRGKGEVRVISRSGYRFGALDTRVRKILAATSKNRALHLVSNDILSYCWTSSLDETMLRQMLQASDSTRYRQLDLRTQQELGVPLARVLAAFGPQYGIILNRIVESGLFPVPQLTFFVQVRDRQTARTVLDALRRDLARRGTAPEETEVVAGTTIHSWPVLPGEATRPAVALTGEMLYIANGRPILRAILANPRSPEALAPAVAETMGPEMAARFVHADYSALFVRPARLAGQVRGLAGWLARLVAASNNISLEPLNREVLQLLRSVAMVAAATDLEKNSASSEVVIRAMSEESGQ